MRASFDAAHLQRGAAQLSRSLRTRESIDFAAFAARIQDVDSEEEEEEDDDDAAGARAARPPPPPPEAARRVASTSSGGSATDLGMSTDLNEMTMTSGFVDRLVATQARVARFLRSLAR